MPIPTFFAKFILSSSNVATVSSPPEPAVLVFALISTVPLDALLHKETTSEPGKCKANLELPPASF